MKHAIIGAAGHVDHGKTTLIEALTGTNADRLKEEQERGMTIDLGFAALRLPNGVLAGVVDVPGHERFLKNMLAGATGIDVALLVIAADESVMPQTREHLDILGLLDVRESVVAITKVDLVDEDWLQAVEEDVREELRRTPLKDAPVIRVSSVTGLGLDALKRALMASVSRAPERPVELPFRLPIDRVFTRPGFGTVVTGTLVAGHIHTGDVAEIVPQGISARIRGLQTHGKKVDAGEAGTRVAVNLAGIETAAIERGAQLAAPHTLAATMLLDADLRLLPGAERPLRDRSRVRVHIGTAEVLARVKLLDERHQLEPGDSGFVQLRAESPLACARGDRFVLRSYSPMHTIGGGTVLDPAASFHRKAQALVLEGLTARVRGQPDEILHTSLMRQPAGAARRDLPGLTGLSPEALESAIASVIASGAAVRIAGDRLIHRAVLTALESRARGALGDYHARSPLRSGMPREELRGTLGQAVDARTYGGLLTRWQEEGWLRQDASTVRLSEFQVQLNEKQQALLARIEDEFRRSSIAAPTISEAAVELRVHEDAVSALLRVGADRGTFVRAADDVYYHHQTIDELKRIVADRIRSTGHITVADLRDITQTNRKFALQAMEYLDSIRFTRRQGDVRVLAGG